MQAVITDEVKAIHEGIVEIIGPAQHQMWFTQATRLHCHQDHIDVAASNQFICNWVQLHFGPAIADAARKVLQRQLPVKFRVDETRTPKPAPGRDDAPPQRPDTAPRLSPPKLKRSSAPPLKLTLDTFVVGSANQLAYNAAKSILRNDVTPFNPLFVHGGYGVGKTHLLQGVCNAVSARQEHARWMYLSAEDFANQYVVALKTRKLDAFRRRFRNLDVLAIDDIHFLANKNAMQEEFLHTFNSIDLAGKQVLLASDAHPRQISQLCEKLVNRFVSGMVVRMDAPDFETRCRICAQRSKSMKLELSQEVIEFIANQLSTNVRELEGALVKLAAFRSLSGQTLTLSIAQQVLDEHMTRMDPQVHNSEIVSVVAAYFGVSVSNIHSAKKDRTITLARSVAMYLNRRFTKMSFPEIGRAMGGKNHATVILACRRIEDALGSNDALKWKVPNGWRNVPAREVVNTLIEKIA